MGNKLPERIESQMIDFEKFLTDVNQLNILFQYQHFKEFNLCLEIRGTKRRSDLA
jgi:hypothetical protein